MKLEPGKGLVTVKDAKYEEYELSQRPESYNLMKQTLEEFQKFVRKQEVASITRVDLLKYKQWLVNRGRTHRTAGNKMLRVNLERARRPVDVVPLQTLQLLLAQTRHQEGLEHAKLKRITVLEE